MIPPFPCVRLFSGIYRRRADVRRTSCGLRSASVGAGQTSTGRPAVYAPPRSAQDRRPPDVLRSTLRLGRRRTDVRRTSCGLRSASVGAGPTSAGRLAVYAPLRSAQDRRPPDVLRRVLPASAAWLNSYPILTRIFAPGLIVSVWGDKPLPGISTVQAILPRPKHRDTSQKSPFLSAAVRPARQRLAVPLL